MISRGDSLTITPRAEGRTDLPRVVLFSAEPPQSATAGGIALQRLLADYPPDRLLVVSSGRIPPGASSLSCQYLHHPLSVDRLHRTRFWPWRNRLSVAGGPRLLPLRALRRACAAFRPDVILTLMQDSWYYTLGARLAAAVRRPLVLLVHDLPHLFEPVPERLHRRQLRRDAATAQAAAARIFVSTGMQQWCREHYQVEGHVLLPPASGTPRHDERPMDQTLRVPGHLTLGYAGGLHYGYGEELLRLVPVLRATHTRLRLYTDRPAGAVRDLLDATDVATWCGRTPTPEQTWPRVAHECDVVLQPYLNPPGPHQTQYRTHFPSKLGDLLALGRPVLVTGPADASGVRWCRARPNSALVITAAEPAAFRDAFERLRVDRALRQRLTDGAAAASEEFNPAPLRTELHQHLRRAAALAPA